jgi:hypothetical protein
MPCAAGTIVELENLTFFEQALNRKITIITAMEAPRFIFFNIFISLEQIKRLNVFVIWK